MRVGFNLFVVGGHIEEEHRIELEKLSRLGYDGAEIPIFRGDTAHYAKVATWCEHLGLARTACTAMPLTANPISADKAVRAAGADYLRYVIDAANALGAPVICGPLYAPVGYFTGVGPTADERAWGAETLRSVGDHAAAAGVELAMEPLNRFECFLLNTVEQGVAFRQQVGHPAIGLMYDTFHAHIEERDPVAAFSGAVGTFNHIHISENDRGIPGRGHAALRPVIQAARRAGYDGWLTVEAFGTGVPELAAATRIWRELFPSTDVLFAESIALIRGAWDDAEDAA